MPSQHQPAVGVCKWRRGGLRLLGVANFILARRCLHWEVFDGPKAIFDPDNDNRTDERGRELRYGAPTGLAQKPAAPVG
jgi:hypothetical protein